jgi:hypothetical protein
MILLVATCGSHLPTFSIIKYPLVATTSESQVEPYLPFRRDWGNIGPEKETSRKSHGRIPALVFSHTLIL